MNRNDLIVAINNLFDENTDLKVRNEYLEGENKRNNKTCILDQSPRMSEEDYLLLEYGKEQLREKVISTYNRVSAWKLEESNEIKTTDFETWVKDKIDTYYIPEMFSKKEIINIFYNELNELYGKEKAEAIKKLEREKDEDNN